jgi:hypothetical protein
VCGWLEAAEDDHGASLDFAGTPRRRRCPRTGIGLQPHQFVIGIQAIKDHTLVKTVLLVYLAWHFGDMLSLICVPYREMWLGCIVLFVLRRTSDRWRKESDVEPVYHL